MQIPLGNAWRCSRSIFILRIYTTEEYLTINDLAEVRNEMWDARSKWYIIGLELGITPGTLDAISRRSRDNPDECLTTVLVEFLRHTDHKPSWKRLADAMASPAVGYRELAEQLRRKYIIFKQY